LPTDYGLSIGLKHLLNVVSERKQRASPVRRNLGYLFAMVLLLILTVSTERCGLSLGCIDTASPLSRMRFLTWPE